MKQSKGTIPESFRVAVFELDLGIKSILPLDQQQQYMIHVTSKGPSTMVVGGEYRDNGNFGGSKAYLGRHGFLRHGGRIVADNAENILDFTDELEKSPLCNGFTILEVPQCPINLKFS